MKKHLKFLAVLLTSAAVLFSACKKDKDKTSLSVRLGASNPGNFEELNLEIKSVLISYDDDAAKWTDLAKTEEGVPNFLLDGKDIEIAKGSDLSRNQTVKHVRIVFGPLSKIKVKGEAGAKQLVLSDAATKGITLKTKEYLGTATEIIALDINTTTSVTRDNDGNYNFNPVLTVKE